MENAIFTYLIKVSISLVFFYGLYILCLRKDKFLKQRRFYFLFTIFFSLLFPLFTIEINTTDINGPIPAYWLPQIEVGNTPQMKSNDFSIQSLLTIVFSLITICLLSRLTLRLASIFSLWRKNKPVEADSKNIVILDNDNSVPFSFFNWIFIPRKTDNENVNKIIAHENEHVRQKHSIDILISELFCAVFWWNPFAWLLRKEIKINLEYLADQGVLEKGFDCQEYQYALLNASRGDAGMPLVNNFNVSQLKKRIAMMNKKKTPILSATKYLLAAPIAAMLLLGNVVQATPELIDISSKNPEMNLSIAQDSMRNGVYNIVDQMPQYPGGESEMQKFISENLKYPETAQKEGIQGRVIVRFVVEKTGAISNIEVIRGIGPDCDKEAIRTIKAMPNWIPGKTTGRIVPVYFTLPIVFKLTGDNSKKTGSKTISQASNSSENKPFATVEQMPQFPGGESEMQKFISENLKYPETAQKEGIQGRVTVRFVVEKTGAISNVTLMRGIDPDCDKEAIRMIKSMPNWKPGKMKGIEVPVYFTLPIIFKLSK